MEHPLHTFHFCPRCGSSEFAENDARSKRCKNCDFTFYVNSSAATAAIIRNNRGKILLTRRAFDPGKGLLDLPGGFVDPGESIEAGCLREIREELGVEAHIRQFLFTIPNHYSFGGFVVPTVDSFFDVELLDNDTLHAGDDAAELLWISPSDLRLEDIALSSIREGLRRLFAK